MNLSQNVMSDGSSRAEARRTPEFIEINEDSEHRKHAPTGNPVGISAERNSFEVGS